jgi:catechol 2,3-dioxygenase-like lactoylglutathione lyase family enzyme
VTAPRPAPSVHSIAIFVHDIGRALEFYRDKLALPLAKQGSFGAEFFGDGVRIGVHPAVHADARALVGRHTGITLHVPDLLHYCGELHDRGVRFVAEPTQQAWGSWRWWRSRRKRAGPVGGPAARGH